MFAPSLNWTLHLGIPFLQNLKKMSYKHSVTLNPLRFSLAWGILQNVGALFIFPKTVGKEHFKFVPFFR